MDSRTKLPANGELPFKDYFVINTGATERIPIVTQNST